MKLALWILGILLMLGVAGFGLLVWWAKRDVERKNEHDVLQYIAAHPEQCSMYAAENGHALIDYKSEVKRPLASVLKIVVAVEFAERVADGTVNPEESVALDSLQRFYIPGSDGGAHEAWRKSLGADATKDVALIEAAKGMMRYSSNANTDFLIERLGLEAINKRIQTLDLSAHDPIYPLSSAMLMHAHLQEDGLRAGEAEAAMREMSAEQYAAKSVELFDKHRADASLLSALQAKPRPLSMQRIWSDRLPAATAREYADLLRDIQSGNRLSPEAAAIVRDIMETPVKPESHFSTLAHKGGSSLNILNEALYSEDKSKNRLQLALFMHGANRADMLWLEKKLDLFLRRYLTDTAFRQTAAEALGSGTE
ncbi:serine hydrolase [Paenibacillaceae bacterium WGS1546]|uniref:serine hydrolase n=1 Tax=Cohnella sp. WGS1546 TaxID=3366810 RepID=UPI00372D5236